ncbi:Nif11-like leader peptide family natural product precursor [Nostoc sp.]|uniref:Nif11-like leader peptide family natural product precursor n=1 Tax=Nostoc sp. TaxID=1180 RepID=UPI002FF9C470
MSKQNLEQFYTLVQNSEELQQQLGSIQDSQTFNEMAVCLGQENSYSFTVDEVEAFLNEKIQQTNTELSDQELEAVAGGKKKTYPINTDINITLRSIIPDCCCWGSKC